MAQGAATRHVRKPGNRVSIIDTQGEVTAAAAKQLTAAYEQASEGGARSIILNFTGLEYMNSSGIGLLVTRLIRANRAGQRLLAYGLSDHYQHIFELTRLNEAIRIYDTEAHAVGVATAL